MGIMDPNNLPHHVYLHKDHKYRLKLGFYAAPSNPKAFSKAIRDELHNLKFTYCSDLNGLIMGFGKISSNELIPADIRHCINVVVNVDVYIFRPPVGSIIEAVVNQTSDNHVSCLVHNLFNVSIVRPENKPYDQWSGSKVKKDDKIDVKVLSFDLTKKLPHITGEIIKKKDECYDPKDNIQNSSSIKSPSSKNNVSDVTKSFNKNTVSTSKCSSSDSESSDEMDNIITKSKICADVSTKTSPVSINNTIKHGENADTVVSFSKCSSSDSESLDEMDNMINKYKIIADVSTKKSPISINTTIKHGQKADTAVSISKCLSSDSESADETDNMITKSKICADVSTITSPVSINTSFKRGKKADTTVNISKCSSDSDSSDEMDNNMIAKSTIYENKSAKPSVSTNTTNKHQDTADNSSRCSSSDSEFSSEIKVNLTNFEECNKNKSPRTSSLIFSNVNNSKHIKSPLYSSTPILNSEHSVNSINLIRNKQLEQLKKHLAKNSTGKRKSLDSVKVPNQFVKDKLSQSLNILKNIKNNDNNGNSLKVLATSVNIKDNKKKQHGNLLGDSGVSDCELQHKNVSANNSFLRKSEKSTKTIKKHQKSNEIVDAILNSISNSKKMKSSSKITNNLVDTNYEKEENTVYPQNKHNLDEGLLINHKHLNEPAIKNSLKLNLSTKNIRREDTPLKKNMDDSENQIKNKVVKKSSTIKLSMISDSDSNCSKDLKIPVKDLNLETDLNKEVESDTSSSDDELYSKLRQNISRTQINTSYYNENPKNLYDNIYHSTDESDSSSKLFYKASKLFSKSIKSNSSKHASSNVSEIDGCNKNNLLSNKKRVKKDKKKKEVNEQSALSQSSNKMDIIKHILGEDFSSDDDATVLKNRTSDEKKANENVSRKKSTLNVSKPNQNDGLLKKGISNPFLKIYTENITSSDDETFILDLIKKNKKSSKKKQVNTSSVNEEEKKNILINQVLDSIKCKNKKQKQMIPVSQNNSKASESKKKLSKNDKITKDKPIVKTKNKKSIPNNLKISFTEPNMPNLNISQKVESSQLNRQPSSDENTEEEENVIKEILKQRKHKKTKKATVPEESVKINIPKNLNKQNEIKEKLHTKSESQNASTTDEVKSNDLKKKKKRRKETKDSLLDSIISALENSSDDHVPSKKKKKDHNLTIEESHDSKDKNSDGYLSEVKIKKKKKSKHKDNVNLSDSIVKDDKKNEAKVDNTFVKVSKKKKVKSNQNTITDQSSKIVDELEDNKKRLTETMSSKKKTKKLLKSKMEKFMSNQDTTDLDKLYDLLNI
ncbi:hypothetical protein ACI65C_010598 [Semiaphis heraclei]